MGNHRALARNNPPLSPPAFPQCVLQKSDPERGSDLANCHSESFGLLCKLRCSEVGEVSACFRGWLCRGGFLVILL